MGYNKNIKKIINFIHNADPRPATNGRRLERWRPFAFAVVNKHWESPGTATCIAATADTKNTTDAGKTTVERLAPVTGVFLCRNHSGYNE